MLLCSNALFVVGSATAAHGADGFSQPSSTNKSRSKPAHSITSSARASSVGDTSRPIDLAVLRLTMSSYFVGNCTGSSEGLAPFRIRSTYDGACWNKLIGLGP